MKILKLIISTLNTITKSLSFRKNGISGHMCVRNEENTLRESVESIIWFLDELIIQYNDCTDNSEKIILDLKEKYPNKIRVYKWEKKPFKIWEYRNFGMRKTKYRWYMKIDADQIYNIKENYRDIILNSKKTTLYLNGGICPFLFNKKYYFLKEVSTNWVDENKKEHNASNISEAHYLFVRGIFDKYVRNDKTSYCEYIRIYQIFWKEIYIDDFFIHFINIKRCLCNNLERSKFVQISNIDIKKAIDLKIDKNIKLFDLLKTKELNEIADKFSKSKRQPFWYERKVQDWDGEIN